MSSLYEELAPLAKHVAGGWDDSTVELVIKTKHNIDAYYKNLGYPEKSSEIAKKILLPFFENCLNSKLTNVCGQVIGRTSRNNVENTYKHCKDDFDELDIIAKQYPDSSGAARQAYDGILGEIESFLSRDQE